MWFGFILKHCSKEYDGRPFAVPIIVDEELGEKKEAIHCMFQLYYEGIKTTLHVCTATTKAACIFHGSHKNGNDLKTENTQPCQVNVKICQCKHGFRNGPFDCVWRC